MFLLCPLLVIQIKKNNSVYTIHMTEATLSSPSRDRGEMTKQWYLVWISEGKKNPLKINHSDIQFS